MKSPTCIVSIETVTKNYESYLYLLARFPTSPSESRLDPQQSQYMGFSFDGDAFQSFNRELLLVRVPEADRSAVEATEHKGSIFKLELTYQPDKVTTRSKDNSEEFSMPKSSYGAQLLSYLVEIGGPRTLTLCGPYRVFSTHWDGLVWERGLMLRRE